MQKSNCKRVVQVISDFEVLAWMSKAFVHRMNVVVCKIDFRVDI